MPFATAKRLLIGAKETEAFCRMLAFAAERFSDTDIGCDEGALAVEKLKELGATVSTD